MLSKIRSFFVPEKKQKKIVNQTQPIAQQQIKETLPSAIEANNICIRPQEPEKDVFEMQTKNNNQAKNTQKDETLIETIDRITKSYNLSFLTKEKEKTRDEKFADFIGGIPYAMAIGQNALKAQEEVKKELEDIIKTGTKSRSYELNDYIWTKTDPITKESKIVHIIRDGVFTTYADYTKNISYNFLDGDLREIYLVDPKTNLEYRMWFEDGTIESICIDDEEDFGVEIEKGKILYAYQEYEGRGGDTENFYDNKRDVIDFTSTNTNFAGEVQIDEYGNTCTHYKNLSIEEYNNVKEAIDKAFEHQQKARNK